VKKKRRLKRKPKFTPVMTKPLAGPDPRAFAAALAASDQLAIVETRRTITFRFRKRIQNRRR
jgi:hypothetical protein